MKYLSLLFLLILSQFTNGQHVFTKFEKVVMFDDFSYVSNRWEQKNNGSESFIISNNIYSLKRLKDNYFAISLPLEAEEYADFELVSAIRLDYDKANKNVTGGLVLKAQKTGNGALILEFNSKSEYRIIVMDNGRMNSLFGGVDDGWKKSKNLKKRDFNEIRISTQGNEFDLYFNKKYERTFIETTFEAGKVGFYAGPSSGISIDFITVRANEAKVIQVVESKQDKTYTELAELFTGKINKQQAEIDELSRALNICKSSYSMDTMAVRENKTLKKDNSELNQRLLQLESQYERAQQRLTYLESMKADIESNPNGDIILNLTEMLSREKEKSATMKLENEKLKEELKTYQQRY